MRILRLASALLVFAVFCGGTTNVQAETKITPQSVGSAQAPIVVHEFLSLTCSHCADFYTEVLPELKKRYADTGKVRFVLHDFPLDGIALKASVLAHCMPTEQYLPFINVLYTNFRQWVTSNDPEKTLLQYASLGGLSGERAKACLADTKLMDSIISQRAEASAKYNVQATPTFVINDGAEKIVGSRSVEDFSAIFDRLLAAKR